MSSREVSPQAHLQYAANDQSRYNLPMTNAYQRKKSECTCKRYKKLSHTSGADNTLRSFTFCNQRMCNKWSPADPPNESRKPPAPARHPTRFTFSAVLFFIEALENILNLRRAYTSKVEVAHMKRIDYPAPTKARQL